MGKSLKSKSKMTILRQQDIFQSYIFKRKRWDQPDTGLLGAGVLGDGLGPLGHSVLGQLAGQQEADRGLDLSL